jgi:hypothetical protein
VSSGLVLAASVPGPVRRALAVQPLRLLGLVSYGVYLVHWPIFLVVDADRTGLDRTALFALRVAITLAVALASYRLAERPVRRGWSMPRAPMPALATAALAVVALTAAAVPTAAPHGMTHEERVVAYLEGIKFRNPANIPTDARIGIGFGDSTMLETGMGLASWGKQTEDLVLPGTVGDLLGCGVSRGGERRSRGRVTAAPEGCDAWAETIPHEVASLREKFGRLEFAVVQTGPWDVADRRLEGSDEWLAPGDEEYDDYLRSEMSTLTDLLLDEGVYVVWATAPHLDVGRGRDTDEDFPENDPARVDRFNEIVREVMDARDGAVTLELQALLDQRPGGEFEATYTGPDGDELILRPDGVHFETEGAIELAREGLGDALLEALWREPVPPGTDWADRTPEIPPATTTTTVEATAPEG